MLKDSSSPLRVSRDTSYIQGFSLSRGNNHRTRRRKVLVENFHSQEEVYKDLQNFITSGLAVDTVAKSDSQKKLEDKNLINNLIKQVRL